MKLESVGIIINIRPFGERDAVTHIFTRDFGVLAGMLRGALTAKKNRPLVGQFGPVSWNARLETHVGTFHFESARNMSAPLMGHIPALLHMNSAFALLAALLPEREKYESLYVRTENLLSGLENCVSDHDNAAGRIRQLYTDWEVWFLQELGYALDLTRCSNCGCVDGLTHISHRSGRAVCERCAAPYLDKCFPLPVDLIATKYFLSRMAESQGARLPHARNMI
ncbi:MAG: DNA repair protein RecO [Rickettsiales bacterium]|jgi:DNA repair protein RecO (recombination protein O)|nr:DNA repair protein RecO [Rickettsiales bacterium]